MDNCKSIMTLVYNYLIYLQMYGLMVQRGRPQGDRSRAPGVVLILWY